MERQKKEQKKQSLIGELTAGMKVSDIRDAGEKKPEREILYDGYRRRTLEQDMYCTDRYRTRYLRKAIMTLLVIIGVGLVILALKENLL